MQREFEDYLQCGRLEHGFLRVRCESCHTEHLVVFICKRRGFCPSCGARRMAESAALLVDEVFPEQPVRQWVLMATVQGIGCEKLLDVVKKGVCSSYTYALKWQQLKPFEKFARMIERHWDGIAAYCEPQNKVSLGFVEGLNNKIRVIQRRAYGLRDEEYLRLKILTCMLPK